MIDHYEEVCKKLNIISPSSLKLPMINTPSESSDLKEQKKEISRAKPAINYKMMKLGNQNPFILQEVKSSRIESNLPALKHQASLFDIPLHIDPKKLRQKLKTKEHLSVFEKIMERKKA